MYYTNIQIMVNYLKIVNILIINADIRRNFVFLLVWDCEYSVNRGVTLLSLFLKYILKTVLNYFPTLLR